MFNTLRGEIKIDREAADENNVSCQESPYAKRGLAEKENLGGGDGEKEKQALGTPMKAATSGRCWEWRGNCRG